MSIVMKTLFTVCTVLLQPYRVFRPSPLHHYCRVTGLGRDLLCEHSLVGAFCSVHIAGEDVTKTVMTS